ncbi:helix-turn-helix transcriptional regulator [Paraburkholderia sp. A1RI-2L]|uniref:helix-turn-helix transcriptional regulator n=1 Tax=Paraburkholderia sp. A1RI-2L TaxID=3028367 RepID=UPI003B814EE7
MQRVSSTTADFAADLSRLGAAIRAVRKEKEISQETLAHLAGVDRSHMGRIERGERNVTILNVLRIALALNCLPSDLLQRANL